MARHVIQGTRIPVHQIVHIPANGDTIEDILECLDYAAVLAENIINSQIPTYPFLLDNPRKWVYN